LTSNDKVGPLKSTREEGGIVYRWQGHGFEFNQSKSKQLLRACKGGGCLIAGRVDDLTIDDAGAVGLVRDRRRIVT
jgi:hypothetical protein